MKFTPRPYQATTFSNVNTLFSSKIGDLPNLKIGKMRFHIDEDSDIDAHVKNILIVAPPGAGKGDMIAYMAQWAWNNGAHVLLWVHKNELVLDLADRMIKDHFVPKEAIGFIKAGIKENRRARIQVASVMTAIRRDISWFKLTLKLTDESHRMLSNSQMDLHKRTDGAYMVSFTATPVRTDKKRKFSEVYDALLQLTTYRELMMKKYLVPTRVVAPKGQASLEGVRIRMGEYKQGDLEKKYIEERIIRSMYARWKEYTKGKMQTMCFNVSQKHNRAVYEFFKLQGVRCEYVDDKTPEGIRDDIVAKFQAGPFVDDPIMVLFNISIFSEGVNAPFCKCVILNYATKSFSKYIQSTARGSRPVWNEEKTDWLRLEDGRYYKEKLLVIDMGGNTNRHCRLEDYDVTGFDLSGEVPKGIPPTKVCPGCNSVIYASYTDCPECGHHFEVKEKKDEKKLADEVEFGEISGVQRTYKWVKKFKLQEAKNVFPPGWLRLAAIVHGDRLPDGRVRIEDQPVMPWVYNLLLEKGLARKMDITSPVNQEKFEKWLKKEELNAGTHQTYITLINGRSL